MAKSSSSATRPTGNQTVDTGDISEVVARYEELARLGNQSAKEQLLRLDKDGRLPDSRGVREVLDTLADEEAKRRAIAAAKEADARTAAAKGIFVAPVAKSEAPVLSESQAARAAELRETVSQGKLVYAPGKTDAPKALTPAQSSAADIRAVKAGIKTQLALVEGVEGKTRTAVAEKLVQLALSEEDVPGLTVDERAAVASIADVLDAKGTATPDQGNDMYKKVAAVAKAGLSQAVLQATTPGLSI